MTISSTASEISYAGDDVSVSFPIPFPFDTSADLLVIRTDPDGNPVVLSSGYTVAGGGGSTGTLTLSSALADDYTLTIIDDPERTQTTDYIANDAFPAETHEGALDKLTRIVKRLYQRDERALRVVDGDPASGDGMVLGSVDARKGKYLFFNAITGAIEYAVALATETLSQSIIAQFLNPQITEESNAGVTPSNYLYKPGHIRRYGAVPNDNDAAVQTANTTAFNDMVKVCHNTGITGVIDGGWYYVNGQLLVRAVANDTACRIHIIQDKGSRLVSSVTGSVAGYDFAGFAVRIDGMVDGKWEGGVLDITDATAGVVMQCRNRECTNNKFPDFQIIGDSAGTLATRETRTKIGVRFVGNESVAGSTSYANYFNRFESSYFNIVHIGFDFVVGDGSASTQQPNAQVLIGPQYSRYMTACNFNDTDEHLIVGAWHHLAPEVDLGNASSLTQTGGTATCTLVGHGLETGDIVYITGATPSDYNGITKITKTGDDTFTYTKTNGVAIPSGTTSPATGTVNVDWVSVGYRGETTYSQVVANIEVSGNSIGFFIDDGGSGGNVFNIVGNQNVRSVVEDLSEQNIVIDRQFYGATGTWFARLGSDNVLSITDVLATFLSSVTAPGFVAQQATIASATDVAYADAAGKSVWRITGTTTINTISDPGANSPEITLIFAGALTVNDATTSSGNIDFGGSNLTVGVDDVLTLIWDATNDKWVRKAYADNSP